MTAVWKAQEGLDLERETVGSNMVGNHGFEWWVIKTGHVYLINSAFQPMSHTGGFQLIRISKVATNL